MAEAIVFALPERPESAPVETDWWLVSDGRVIDSGCGGEWVAIAAASSQRKCVALAPAASVRVEYADRPEGLSERQSASAARLAAVDTSLGEADRLHSVSAPSGERVITAVVDKRLMLAWIEWARAAGADPHHVVPVGSLLPPDDQWTEAQFGSQRVLGRSGIVFPFEPALAEQIAGTEHPRELERGEVDATIARAAEHPPIDLRTGKLARRRRIVVDRSRIRELALVAAAIPLLALLSVLIGIVKLEAATDRLNENSLAIAERALGRPVTLESAESELSQRVGGGGGGAMAPLTGLYSALQSEAAVSATELSYRSDGTLSATLAAPAVSSINRVLISVQRDGYRITAVPRQAPDGRAMVDVTVRSVA